MTLMLRPTRIRPYPFFRLIRVKPSSPAASKPEGTPKGTPEGTQEHRA